MKRTLPFNACLSFGKLVSKQLAGFVLALVMLPSLFVTKGMAQSAAPYCNFAIDNTFGMYAYDNVSGNNFYITNISITGGGVTSHTDLVGGTSDAAKPSAGLNQGVLLSNGATVTQGFAPTFSVSNKAGTYASIYRIYVDWDNNNQFTDAQDLLYTSGTITGSIHTFSASTFVIPVTATTTATNTVGDHRMRVVCEYQGETQRGSCGSSVSIGAQGDAKDFTLTVASATPCSGTPTAGTAAAVSSSLCVNGSTKINLTGATTGLGGIIYQWQESSFGTPGSYTNVIAGNGTNQSYTTPSLANGTGSVLNYYYRCVVTCSNSGLGDSSAVATVAVQPAASVIATATPSSINAGASSALNATGATTYKWLPVTGLNASTGASVTATPAATITYTVTGTTAAGCTATDTTKVTVTPVSYAYCNFQVLNWGGIYGYDNMLGNTFYIKSVSVNGTIPLNFTGGTTDAGHPSAGYNQGDFTSLGAAVDQATQYTFTVTRPAGTYGCQIRIYVDWNNDNDLTDAGENILTSANLSGSGTTFTGNYMIPVTAPTGGNNTTGAHRMRVVCEWSGEIQTGACGKGGTFDGAQGDAKDFTLTVGAATPCTGTPSGGTATAVLSSLCAKGTTTVNLTGQASGVSGISYQWQSSSTGLPGSYADVVTGTGATSTSYTTPSLVNGTGSPVTYYYQCVVTCANSGLSASSAAATVTVQPAVTITATAADPSINAGSNTTLSATGALTYTWAPAASLNASSGASVTATPAFTTIYTATGTTAAGCKGSDTAKVIVIQPANPYCDFQVVNFFGLYGYDNVFGNNFVIKGVAVNGTTPLNFTGGTSDAGHPAAGYNQGIFTSQSATVRETFTYTWTVTLSTGSYARIVRVYVDWNDNFSFDDAGDNIITSGIIPGNVATTGALSYTLPLTAPLGIHRMRVVCEWSGEVQRGACGKGGGFDGAQGDAKDFSLDVKDINGHRYSEPVVSDQQDNNVSMNVYPNPNSGDMMVELSSAVSDNQEVNIEVVDMLGQTVYVTSFVMDNMVGTASIHLPETISSGLYSVRAVVAGKQLTQKLISVSKN